MSLIFAPTGMRPAYNPNGVVGRSEEFTIAPTAPYIHQGDLVSIAADGTIVRATVGAGNAIVGVFEGVEYRDGTGKPHVSCCWPGMSNAYDIRAYVNTDPNVIYEIQADGPVTRDMIGSQATFVAGTPPAANILTGMSADALDTVSISNVTPNQLAIVGIRDYPDNVWGDAFTTVLVKISQHQRAAQIAPF